MTKIKSVLVANRGDQPSAGSAATQSNRQSRQALGWFRYGGTAMIKKILVTNRSDQPPTGGAATQSNRQGAVRPRGGFAGEVRP